MVAAALERVDSQWIRTHHLAVSIVVTHVHWATTGVMSLKHHIILCNSAKTVGFPAYHEFEYWYANIHDPMNQTFSPTIVDFASPTNLHLHQSPSYETTPHNNYDDQ